MVPVPALFLKPLDFLFSLSDPLNPGPYLFLSPLLFQNFVASLDFNSETGNSNSTTREGAWRHRCGRPFTPFARILSKSPWVLDVKVLEDPSDKVLWKVGWRHIG